MTKKQIRGELLGSNFNNFSSSELETLNRYIARIGCRSTPEEVKLYNFCRFVRWQDISKLIVYERIFKRILKIQGDIVQFGVHNGQTLFAFAHLSEIFEPRNYVRRIWGLDTFEPRLISGEKLLDTYNYETLLDDVEMFNSSRYQSHIKKIDLVKADVTDGYRLLLERNLGVVAALLLYIGDYSEEKRALELMWPLLPKGAVILFGSLNSSDTPGCTRAFLDFPELAGHTLRRYDFATKYSYVVKEL